MKQLMLAAAAACGLAGCAQDVSMEHDRTARALAAIQPPPWQRGTPQERLRRCLDVEIRALATDGRRFVLDKATDLVMSDCRSDVENVTRNMSLAEAAQQARSIRAQTRGDLQSVLP